MHGFYYLAPASPLSPNPSPYVCTIPSSHITSGLGVTMGVGTGLHSLRNLGKKAQLLPRDGRSSLYLWSVLLFPPPLLQKHSPPGHHISQPGIISSRRLGAGGCQICWLSGHFCFCPPSHQISGELREHRDLVTFSKWQGKKHPSTGETNVCLRSRPLSQFLKCHPLSVVWRVKLTRLWCKSGWKCLICFCFYSYFLYNLP